MKIYVYGLDCGDVYRITSEPYDCDRKGTQKVQAERIRPTCESGFEFDLDELLHSIYYEEFRQRKAVSVQRLSIMTAFFLIYCF